jgi:signal transduction histidine kinase/ActR/RegA family two-component response regulator
VSEDQQQRLEQRVLILAPTPRDCSYAQSVLRHAGIAGDICVSLTDVIAQLVKGAGAVLIAEEALSDGFDQLASCIERQPRWSDLPLLLITQHGADSVASAHALELLGNVTLVERPIGVAALISTVRSALRARTRQYETRAHLAELVEADRRKDEFLATLAHELRNPLAPISNAIYLLKQADGSSAVRQLCETMERQVGQMVRLVDDLLELSRITRGKIELRLAPGSLHGAIEAAIETSRPLIEASGHVLHLHLSSEPITLNADAVRLAQVFSNLLNNAAKYTEPGGSITIKAWTESGDAVVEVSDTGIGISSSVLPRVFDMFSQGDSRHRHAQGGLGIGLTLVRTLVEMHGGTVRAASGGIGKGSTFVVRLPLAQASPAQLPAPQADEWHHPGRLQILVVDDNRDAANTLGMLLTMLGSHVEVVYSGAAALRACEKNPPDLVFLDLGMPQMDGYEVARLLRRMPHGQTIRIVALSGWGQERDRSETAAAGFDHHLIKPADIAALQSVLATAVNAHASAN